MGAWITVSNVLSPIMTVADRFLIGSLVSVSAVALYAAYHAGSSAATIKNAILISTVPTASLTGKTVTGGRLNVSGF